MKFVVEKAKREQVWTKIAVMGSSGSGKSYSSLKLATGMREELKKQLGRDVRVLMANTEGSRGRYYANEFDFDIVDLSAPFAPELFIELIDFAVEQKYDILILDSTSPEWEGTGGCLELHALAGGQWQNWKDITPRHQKFLDTIESSPIHIIATMKGKDQYEIEKDEKGKTSIRKLGVGGKQREGFEYIFTCTFMLDQKTHIATAQKDNTHIFEGNVGTILSENYGKKIIQWANDGEVVPPKPTFKPTSPEQEEDLKREFESAKEAIKAKAIALSDAGKNADYVKAVSLRLGEGKKVMNSTLEDLPALRLLIEDLEEIDL